MTEKPTEKKRNPAGRPCIEFRPEYVEQVFELYLLGSTDDKTASYFDISKHTLYSWKEKYPEFAQAMIDGKTKADAHVAASLYKRALGMEYQEEVVVKVRVGQFKERVEVVTVTKRLPPDVGACTNWLKNRDRANWKDSSEVNIVNKHETALEDLE